MIDREMSQLQAEYEADQFTLCPPSLDFPSILCHTDCMTYTRDQLITALAAEYSFLCHDDFDPDVDMSESDHLEYLNSLTIDQLIDETTTDDEYTLDTYLRDWL